MPGEGRGQVGRTDRVRLPAVDCARTHQQVEPQAGGHRRQGCGDGVGIDARVAAMSDQRPAQCDDRFAVGAVALRADAPVRRPGLALAPEREPDRQLVTVADERGEVGRVVFIEGMILTAISGFVGMALGAAIVWGFFRNGLDFSAIWDMEMEAAGVVIDPVIVPRFHWNQILQSLAFILVIGSLASVYPAWRATRIDVAEAMRTTDSRAKAAATDGWVRRFSS